MHVHVVSTWYMVHFHIENIDTAYGHYIHVVHTHCTTHSHTCTHRVCYSQNSSHMIDYLIHYSFECYSSLFLSLCLICSTLPLLACVYLSSFTLSVMRSLVCNILIYHLPTLFLSLSLSLSLSFLLCHAMHSMYIHVP